MKIVCAIAPPLALLGVILAHHVGMVERRHLADCAGLLRGFALSGMRRRKLAPAESRRSRSSDTKLTKGTKSGLNLHDLSLAMGFAAASPRSGTPSCPS
jgi:hypothetical protein